MRETEAGCLTPLGVGTEMLYGGLHLDGREQMMESGEGGWYKWDQMYSISSELTVLVSCFCGCKAASWVDSCPIDSVSCAEQGQGEMTLVWQWYGRVQCEKVWVQGYY